VAELVDAFDDLSTRIKDALELLELAEAEADEEVAAGIEVDLDGLESDLRRMELARMQIGRASCRERV